MKYFIDFEAAQFSGQIISVGCVREDGERFYSLVHPEGGRVNGFIEKLTGITQEMVNDAPRSEQVFSELFTWLNGDIAPEFYAWGRSDRSFALHTSHHCEDDVARSLLEMLSTSIIDFSKQFKAKAGIDFDVSLKDAAKCFGYEAERTHNAMDDATTLLVVYGNTETASKEYLEQIVDPVAVEYYKKHSTPKKKTPKPNDQGQFLWNESGLPSGTICATTKTGYLKKAFASVEEAIDWVCENKTGVPTRKDMAIHIIASTKKKMTKASYYGSKWRRVA